jgi:hypothetical protein
MQVGDIFQGLRVAKLDAYGDEKYIQLEYPVGHPRRAYYEEEEARYAREMAAFEAGTWVPEYEGQTKPHEPNRWNTNFSVPTPSKTGLPARRDTVGRFLAGLSGGSERFLTDGSSIISYGYHWMMVRATECDDKGNVTKAHFDMHMWEKPYSNTTSQHMQAVRNDPRLWNVVTNRDDFPDQLIDRMARRIAEEAIDLGSVEDMRKAIYEVVGYATTPEEKVREAFKRARPALHTILADERKQARDRSNVGRLRQRFTKESVDAYLAWYGFAPSLFPELLGEYEKRHFKRYDEKMPPIPTRKPGLRRPELVAKPYEKPTPKARAKGVLAWHFLDASRKLRFGDGRMVDVGTVVDVLLEERGMEIALCDYGLHGSRNMQDAYSYYNGAYLTRTLHYGIIEDGPDKLASQYRECLGMIDLRSPIGQDIMSLLFNKRGAEAEKVALSAMEMAADQRTPSAAGIVDDGERAPRRDATGVMR